MKHRPACRLAISLAVLAFPPGGAAIEPPQCVTSIRDLRTIAEDASFPLHWLETSMNDGKPLIVSIQEHEGSLFLRFMKTREGLWAEGAAVICKSNGALHASIDAARMRLGPAAHWLLRQSLRHGGTFVLSRIANTQLRISVAGWHGEFAPGGTGID